MLVGAAMLTSITLQNFKSFGEEQTVPLRPITAIVGPNNSGKSNLVSLARFVRNAVEVGVVNAIDFEGGNEFVWHRPEVSGGFIRLGWNSEQGHYFCRLAYENRGLLGQQEEVLSHVQWGNAWGNGEGGKRLLPGQNPLAPMSGLTSVLLSNGAPQHMEIVRPVILAREIKLQLAALREDAEVVPRPSLGSNGSGLAAVLGLWRGSDPERADQLQDFVRRCLPEVRNVFVKPSPEPSFQRLWIQQTDGQQFDAEHVSDGVLFFIALAMQAIEAGPGSLLFVEEPEQSIHPRRVGMIMDLFRQVVAQRGCQVVVVTHSPVLLNELRDEPESIVLFRRGDQGTRVKQLTEMPDLLDALRDSEPGEMLANGFFDAPF